MQTRDVTSLAVAIAGATLIAVGCSDDDEMLERCRSGNCAGGTGGMTSGTDRPTASGGASTSTAVVVGGATFGGATSVTSEPGLGGVAGSAGSSSTPLVVAGAGGTQPQSGGASQGGAAPQGSSTLQGGTTASGFGGVGVAGTTFSLAGAGNTPVEPTPGVAILKYDFEDGSGTTVTDTTGNGRNGVLSGASWTGATEGRNAMAVGFAAADSAVALPPGILDQAAGLSVTAWVMLTANEPGNRLFDIGTALGNHIYFTFNNQSGGMELGLQVNDGALATLFTTAQLPLNVWKHIAVVLGSKGARLFVDGWEVARSVGLTTSPSALGHTTANWVGKSVGPEPAFAGRIDEFYVYDNPIGVDQIRQLAWPKTDYSIWHFDESDGTVAADSSDLHRDATMVRATFNEGIVGNGAQLYNPNDTNEIPPDADQYVKLPDGVVKDCTQGYTVATWINVIAVRSHARVFEFSNDNEFWVFGRIKGGMTEHFAVGDFSDGAANSDANYASIAYTWPVNSWHHVAAVRDGQALHAYIDGVETGPKAPQTLQPTVPPISSLGTTLHNYIGRTKDSAAVHERRRLHGRVDEFLLSCRAYSADEIKLLATRP